MSYAYYHYLTRDLDYEAARSRFHLAQSLRRSRERIEADAITEEVLRRSRVQVEIATQEALRRSRIQADIIAVSAAKEVALRRSRVQAQIAAQNVVREESLRRSRMDVELEFRRQTTDAILRRSRVDAVSNSDKVANTIAKSRLESELQASRISSQNLLKDFARREKIKQDVDKILNRY